MLTDADVAHNTYRSPVSATVEQAATVLAAAAVILLVGQAVLTLVLAEDQGGGSLPIYLFALLLGGVGAAGVGLGMSSWWASTSDAPEDRVPIGILSALVAIVVYALVIFSFDRIRAAFDYRDSLGSSQALSPTSATVYGFLAGALLFLLPVLLAVIMQRSPDTSPLVGPLGIATSMASLGVGLAGLLIAYGGAWVPTLVRSLPQRAASGVLTGSILAVAALGLSLIFGVLKLINFAHAQFMLVGAYVALYFNISLGWSIWVSIIPAVIVGALLGVASDIVLFRPMRRRGYRGLVVLILSIGLGLFLQNLVLFTSRGDPGVYDLPRQTRASLFGWDLVRLTPTEYILIGTSVALVVGVALMLTYSRLGKAVRAAADNSDLAELSGIDVNRVIAVIWIIGGAFAAYGGVAAGLQFNAVTPLLGLRFILPLFAAVIVGGLGTAYGALVGGLLVGLAQELAPVLPFLETEAQEVVGFALLVAVLLLRPQGILGVKERI